MLNSIKHWIKLRRLRYTPYDIKSKESIKLFWWNIKNNFGDSINPNLISSLTSKQVEWVPSNYEKEYYISKVFNTSRFYSQKLNKQKKNLYSQLFKK